MKTLHLRRVLLLSFATCIIGDFGCEAGVLVDTKLSLVIDVSGSVDSIEFSQQMTGYRNAFRDPIVQALILDGPIGKAAVNTVFFATGVARNPFTLLDSTASINAFADTFVPSVRPLSGGIGTATDVGSGIRQGRAGLQSTSDFMATRLVMDVSGDGVSNDGVDPSIERDDALARGIAINAIVIGNSSLVTYYEDNVISPGGFVLRAASFNDFENAIGVKLVAELQSVPEPSTIAMLATLVIGITLRSPRPTYWD